MHCCPSCTNVHCTELEKSAFFEPLIWVKKVHFMGHCNDVWGKYNETLDKYNCIWWQYSGILTNTTVFGWTTVVFRLSKKALHIWTIVRVSIRAYFRAREKCIFMSFVHYAKARPYEATMSSALTWLYRMVAVPKFNSTVSAVSVVSSVSSVPAVSAVSVLSASSSV